MSSEPVTVATRRYSKSTPSTIDCMAPKLSNMHELVKAERGTHQDRNGWLLPDGTFYKCKYFQHDKLVEALGYRTDEIENKWVRIFHPGDSSSMDQFYVFVKGITKKQINFIWDWCQHHNLEYPREQIEFCCTK